MSQPVDTQHENDALPAQLSTAGMLLKLILLPGLVVLAIVLAIVLATVRLSPPGDDVDSLIDTLAQEGKGRWPAALTLGAVLNEPKGASIRRDPAVARRLAEILHGEIETGTAEPDQLNLRICLCRILGEFEIAGPLGVLLEAARLQRNDPEADVRRAALEAVAVLAGKVGPAGLRGNPQLVPVLLESAQDPRRQVRERAAFALGVVGGARAQDRLELMLADPHAEIRYNAAAGLARHGSPQCVGVLREMLDPHLADPRRTMIRVNALQAAGKLAAANPTADLGELAMAVERLTRADVAAEVGAKAAAVLRQLERRKGTAVGPQP